MKTTVFERGEKSPSEMLAPKPRKGWIDKPSTAKRCRDAGLAPQAVSNWRHRRDDFTTPDAEVIEIILDNKRRGSRGARRIVSRYHVAKMMELHYGLGWSIRRVARHVGMSSTGVSLAIRAAEAGHVFPEVTAYFLPVEVAA